MIFIFTYKIDNTTKLKMLDLRDAKQLFTLLDQSKESLKEWLPFIDSNKSLADTETFIKSTMKQFSEFKREFGPMIKLRV